MTDKTKIFSWTGLIALNAITVLFVIGLQFLYYGTAPAINPVIYKDNFDKKAACLQATMDFNKTLIIELTIVAIIISALNYFYFRRTTRRLVKWTLLFLLVFIILTGLGLTYFTIDYINRNMEMQ